MQLMIDEVEALKCAEEMMDYWESISTGEEEDDVADAAERCVDMLLEWDCGTLLWAQTATAIFDVCVEYDIESDAKIRAKKTMLRSPDDDIEEALEWLR